MKLKLLDLFSGIGGFSLGLESTGYFETIAFVEKDKFCQQVLKKNFKDIPIESEVRDVKGDRYAADIICGGFPCQPFSVAGKRKGTDDDRYLWDETIRIVRECKPRWFIGENVEGIINIQEGMVLRQVCDDLEKEGFEVQCVVIPASGIGAWHQRKRVWIIAQNPNNSRCKDRTKQHRRQQTQSKERINSSSRSDFISNSNNYGSHRSKGNETIESSNQSKEWLFIRDDQNVPNSNGKRLQGCKFQHHLEIGKQSSTNDGKNSSEEQQTWWQTQSDLCGVPNGVSYELDKDRTNRIKALGNSIVPLIARELGLAIIKAETDG
jgi:DNA (cytosine-5)-methyltransferase 1